MSAYSLDALLEQINNGDNAAIEQAILTYEPYLRMMVRRQLPTPLRARFDSTDIVHSVWVRLLLASAAAAGNSPTPHTCADFSSGQCITILSTAPATPAWSVKSRKSNRRNASRRSNRNLTKSRRPMSFGSAWSRFAPLLTASCYSSSGPVIHWPRSPPGPGCTRAACAASCTTQARRLSVALKSFSRENTPDPELREEITRRLRSGLPINVFHRSHVRGTQNPVVVAGVYLRST